MFTEQITIIATWIPKPVSSTASPTPYGLPPASPPASPLHCGAQPQSHVVPMLTHTPSTPSTPYIRFQDMGPVRCYYSSEYRVPSRAPLYPYRDVHTLLYSHILVHTSTEYEYLAFFPLLSFYPPPPPPSLSLSLCQSPSLSLLL